jgi:hypothetical protein
MYTNIGYLRIKIDDPHQPTVLFKIHIHKKEKEEEKKED